METKATRASELRGVDRARLVESLKESRSELAKLRMDFLQPSDKTAAVKKNLRRNIARLLTVIAESKSDKSSAKPVKKSTPAKAKKAKVKA